MTDTKVRPAPIPPVRTLPEVKAHALALDGSRSRVALAAVDDTRPEVDPNVTVGELWLYGLVGGWWRGFDAESVANALRGMDVDLLYVRIHSPGGDSADGIAIGNLLRNHRAKVVTVVDGYACSAASVIAVAGDEVVMCPGAQLMLHDVMTYGAGNAKTLRLAAEYAEALSQNYASVYQYRAGGTVAQWRSVMLVNDEYGTWYTAEEAVAASLADSVGTVVAIGSPPVAPEDELDDADCWARAAHDLNLLDMYVPAAARAAWQSGERPKPPDRKSADRPTQPKGAAVVDLNDTQIASLREQVGFPADADADTIVKAVAEALTERAEAKVTTEIPEGMELVSKTVFEDVTAKAERGAEAAEELLTMRCTAVLDKYKDRFPATPEARAKWEADFRRDPAATETYLAATKPLLPTTEAGHGGDGENQPVAVTDDPNYQKWSF